MAARISNTTTDHDRIRKWAEERGGRPSEVIGTGGKRGTGIIRIDFPGYSGEGKLREIAWDEWFRKFDDSNLALVYEEQTARGQQSNFNKLVGRETAKARSEGRRYSRRAAKGEGRYRAGATPTRAEAETKRSMSRSRSAERSEGRGRTGGKTRTTGRGAKRSTASRSTGARTGGRRQASRAEAARTTGARRGGRGAAEKGGARGRARTATSRGTSRRGAAGGRKTTRRGGGARSTRRNR